MAKRKGMSLRLRFEIFKRDNFTCRYCGKKSPQVILEVDHIIPVSKGGNSDEINLVTSCFSCNSGKSDRNLSELITGEDPHDKALELAERERQLEEYNYVREQMERRIDTETREIVNTLRLNEYFFMSVKSALRDNSKFDVFNALQISICKKGHHSDDAMPYFWGVLRNITGKGKNAK